jgi:hypothetical protein
VKKAGGHDKPASRVDSNEQEPEEPVLTDRARMDFAAWVAHWGIGNAKAMIKELETPPRGATPDREKSLERSAVGMGLEDGLPLGKAICRVIGPVKLDPNRYHALYELFSVEAVATFWRNVARSHREANYFTKLAMIDMLLSESAEST